MSLDENGSYQLELASSISKISDLEYDFKIKNTSFSNGDPVTLLDVKKTIERSLRGSSHTNLKECIDSISIVQNSLKIRLKKVSKSLFYYLSLPDLGILHHDHYAKGKLKAEDYFSKTSGPFYYNYKNGIYYLIRNDHYKLNDKEYPEIIKLTNPFNENSVKLLIEGKIDLGQVSVGDFFKSRNELRSNLRVIGIPSDSLTYLFFNEHSKKFKKDDHRLWLKKLINDHFKVSPELTQLARRTKQYFPPESKAYLSEVEVEKILFKTKLLERPKDFPEEVVINTYTTTYDVTIEALVKQLESIPGVKIKIKNDILPVDYIKKMKQGDFDIFLNIMSTDFRTPVEAINFEFFSSDSVLRDYDNAVSRNYKEYQEALSETEEILYLKKISESIVGSPQVIPLFHSAIPFVYNADKVDLNGLNHLFIFNFWKLKNIK